MNFLPPTPEELFPEERLSDNQFQEWRDHPATKVLLLELHRRVYDANNTALTYEKSEVNFWERRGEVGGYISLLAWLEDLKGRIANGYADPMTQYQEGTE